MLSNNIVIIDYKMGNLRSVQKAFEKIGCDAVVSSDIEVIQKASKIVLPGVGAFGDGMKHLEELGLIDVLHNEVIKNKKPFLGICLGMQLIAKKSYENGQVSGLGWIDAQVFKFNFDTYDQKLKIPHVGWNNTRYKNKSILFDKIPDESDFYFVHSYYFKTDEDIVTSTTNYGFEFVSSIEKDNIFAFQFHPEKSQNVGLKIIENFINLKSNK